MDLIAPGPGELERWRPPVPDGHPRQPVRSSDATAVWNGVVWGRLGRGDRAWAWWDSVDAPDLQPWIDAERARLLRELGVHDLAQELDERGLAAARDLTDVVMLRLSLAADAVGLGHEAAARRALGTVRGLLAELDDDERVLRQRLRYRWVQVEVALLAGEKPSSEGLPTRGEHGPVFPPEHDAGTDFHRAKGLLFGGVVTQDPTLLRWAAELAPAALRWAIELARLDAGNEDSASRAAGAWTQVVPPPGHESAVASTPTAARLRSLERRSRRRS